MSEKILTIKIRGKAAYQLEDLKKKADALTNSEVVRNALRSYNALLDFRDTDGSLIVEKPNGDRVRLMLP